MSARPFIIVDPALMTVHGHMHNVDIGLQEELRKLGHRVRVIANAAAIPAVAKQSDVVPYFTETAYGGPSADPIAAEMENFIDCGSSLAAELEACGPIADELASSTLVFPTVTPSLLLGMAYWLTGVRSAPKEIIAVFPTDAGFNAETAGVSLTGVLFRYAFNRLAESEAGRASRLMTLTDLQAADFSGLAGRPVELCPYPCSISNESAGSRSSSPTILFCGDGAARKGFALLPPIIAAVKEASPTARFAIQVNGVTPADPTVGELRGLAASVPGIELVEGPMTRPEFLSRLHRADLVMLPYVGAVYRRASSAVFAEARYLGRPTMVPPDTAMARELQSHPDAGVIAASNTADDLAGAVVSALDDLPRLHAGAAVAATAYRERNGIDRFANFIATSATPSR